jgi:hypothetical protein
MFNTSVLTPEYIHVIINHFPIEGLLIAVIALFMAILARSKPAKNLALVLVIISSLSIWPVYHFGDKAYDRINKNTDDDGTGWLDEHEHRAKTGLYFYYGLALFAAAGLIATRHPGKLSTTITLSILIYAASMVAVGGWIAYAGGRIIHVELRPNLK